MRGFGLLDGMEIAEGRIPEGRIAEGKRISEGELLKLKREHGTVQV
jgi:hypothetical protein